MDGIHTAREEDRRVFVWTKRSIRWWAWLASRIQPKDSNVGYQQQAQHLDPPEPPDDYSLMQEVARGNQQALSQLYDRYAATVLGIALKIVQQREAAEEITQEAFWRVWQRASTFDTARGNVAPWLFGIVRNLSIDEIRRRRARPQAVYDDPERPWMADLPDATVDVEGAAFLGEQRAAIAEALKELTPEQREALELAYFSGLTQREIAERLGNPLGTIKTRVRLGLLKLRDLLQGQQWDG